MKRSKYVDVALQAEPRRNAHLKAKRHQFLTANADKPLTDEQLLELEEYAKRLDEGEP